MQILRIRRVDMNFDITFLKKTWHSEREGCLTSVVLKVGTPARPAYHANPAYVDYRITLYNRSSFGRDRDWGREGLSLGEDEIAVRKVQKRRERRPNRVVAKQLVSIKKHEAERNLAVIGNCKPCYSNSQQPVSDRGFRIRWLGFAWQTLTGHCWTWFGRTFLPMHVVHTLSSKLQSFQLAGTVYP